MRVVLLTSGIGIMAWVLLMWLLGPIGIYAGFLLQMLIRAVALQHVARRTWNIKTAWDGVSVGVLMILVGFSAATSVAA